ncbi:MAG: site-2 protease family protein [Candidatus Omnitrophota bacterium]
MLIKFLVFFGFLMVGITIHEFAHGWVAFKLGDSTAKYSGRLTLNPLAHIDPIWTLLIPFLIFISTGFIFGVAKPVPINYWALRNPKRDILWVGLAGPGANLMFAVLLSILLKSLSFLGNLDFIFINLITINVVLGIFNLIPIPPLDGSRILMGLLPKDLANRYAGIEPFGFLILLILLWTGLISKIIWPLIENTLHLLGIAY